MTRPSHLLVALSTLALVGCSVATPLRGPGIQGGNLAGLEPQTLVHVGLTHAVLVPDREARQVFWREVEHVEASLAERPGFIGFSKRAHLGGREAWTMSLWRDQASMRAFVRSEPHRRAMRLAVPALESVTTHSFSTPAATLPMRWDDALAHLAEGSEGY